MVSLRTRSNGHAQKAPDTLPPVTEMAIGTMALIIIGAIDIVARMPRHVSLIIPGILLVAAVMLLAANVVALTRVRQFAWKTFFMVGRYALLAYVVIAGMLELVFVLDHTPGRILITLTLMLLVYAVDIPLLFAFSVARHQPPDVATQQ